MYQTSLSVLRPSHFCWTTTAFIKLALWHAYCATHIMRKSTPTENSLYCTKKTHNPKHFAPTSSLAWVQFQLAAEFSPNRSNYNKQNLGLHNSILPTAMLLEKYVIAATKVLSLPPLAVHSCVYLSHTEMDDAGTSHAELVTFATTGSRKHVRCSSHSNTLWNLWVTELGAVSQRHCHWESDEGNLLDDSQ